MSRLRRRYLSNQDQDGRVVLNYDNEITRDFAREAKNYAYFSRREELETGYYLKDGHIVYSENGEVKRDILDIETIFIPGMHNVEKLYGGYRGG